MSLLIKYLSKLRHICALIRNYKLKIFLFAWLKLKAQGKKLKAKPTKLIIYAPPKNR